MVAHHGIELLADCLLFGGACEGRVALAPAAAAALAAVAAQDASAPGYAAPGGFVPVGEGAASVTLEWALNDNSAALLAAAAGNGSAAAALAARAKSYANVFHAPTPA
jgi:putative alpha-1,2-mannosidase